jgi:prepilin-type N-terminal cleavage/methylation domain-containing protein
MSFNNIKSKSQLERGFTIVELLIVIVVIGILAAITIVSYNGITARANTNSAKANATAFLKKAELYAADGGTNRYPVSAAEVQTGSDADETFYVNPSLTINYSTTALTSATPTSTIRVLKCSAVNSAASDTQAEITGSSTGDATLSGLTAIYFDYAAAAEAELTIGDVTNCPTT